ncbi:phosphotransferase enzyme family protein [Rhodococcus sp. NPDC057529]|uniref:phosphotransferase enzyme family protein n=1 Tax=Rhodococcus sp. NPDC057529 TaxID=3346158 RepID=UPI00366F5AB3
MNEWADIDRVTDSIRSTLPDRYGMSADADVALLGISENANFAVRDPSTGQDGVIRVHRHNYHQRAAIESELAWMAAIRRQTDVLVCDPVAAVDREPVITLPVEGAPDRDAVMFTRVPGKNLTMDDATPAVYERLGAITAQLHDHARHWRRPAGFYRYRWDLETMLTAEARFGYWANHPRLTPADRRLLERAATLIADRLTHFSASEDEPVGLVHGDLHVLNLMVEGEDLWVIDFDDCGIGWYMQDIAPAMACFEEGPLVDELTNAWIRGYEQCRPLSSLELDSLRDFVMLRRMLVLGWSATHPLAQVPGGFGDRIVDVTVSAAEEYLRVSTNR